jgi:MoxR-like ATPase
MPNTPALCTAAALDLYAISLSQDRVSNHGMRYDNRHKSYPLAALTMQETANRHPVTTLKTHLQRTIVGQQKLVERLLITVLAEGHLLVEGVPGLAKTTAVRTLAEGMALRFQRVQFTPDMIPGDITGTDIFVPADGHFRFIEGPLFHEIILADEINRAPPKVQSALLEAMQEHQVTVTGTTHKLPKIFLVMATQNPIEQEGTYPLPEAQLDRFIMKVELDYPSPDEELEILTRDTARLRGGDTAPMAATLSASDILAARRAVNQIYIDPMLERYIVTLVGATREPKRWDDELAAWLARGASPRATLAVARCARARAYLAERDFVEPADILDVAADVLNHRIGLSFAARAEGVRPAQAIARILERVPIP